MLDMPPHETITLFNSIRAKRWKRYEAVERLEALRKPNRDYALRCAAQLPKARRERFLANVREVL